MVLLMILGNMIQVNVIHKAAQEIVGWALQVLLGCECPLFSSVKATVDAENPA